MSEPMRRRREIPAIRILACAFLAIATTVGIAWTSAALVAPAAGRNIPGDGLLTGTFNNASKSLDRLLPTRNTIAYSGGHKQPWLLKVNRPTLERTVFFEKRRAYNDERVSYTKSPAGAGWTYARGAESEENTDRAEFDPPPSIQPEIDDDEHAWGVAHDRRGWPFHAFSCDIIGVRDTSFATAPAVDLYRFRDAITISDVLSGSGASLFSARVLPIRPEWPGLLANIAIFFLAWWFLISGTTMTLRSATRASRHARHRCPQCAYKRDAAIDGACPECGWESKSEVR